MDVLRDQAETAHRQSGGKRPSVTAAQLASACVADYEAQERMQGEISALEQQLEQAGKLADMYREQCIAAEDDLARMREESEVHRWERNATGCAWRSCSVALWLSNSLLLYLFRKVLLETCYNAFSCRFFNRVVIVKNKLRWNVTDKQLQ